MVFDARASYHAVAWYWMSPPGKLSIDNTDLDRFIRECFDLQIFPKSDHNQQCHLAKVKYVFKA